MPIKLQCPGCGKVFRLGGDLAGKQARCRCGAVIQVPVAATEPGDSSWEDEVSRAFTPAQPPRPANRPAQPEARADAAPPEPTPRTPSKTTPKTPSRAAPKKARETVRGLVASLPPIEKWKPKKGDPWPGVVAIACAVYGGLAVLWHLVGIAAGFSGDFFTAACQIALAGGMVCGGILIAKEDPRGPTWTGLASLLFCAFPAWDLLGAVWGFLGGGPGMDFLQRLAISVSTYAVPVAVAVWGLRREIEREKEEGEDY